MKTMGEKVLVFKTSLMDGKKFQGIVTKRDMHDVVSKVLWNNKNLSFMERELAENDPEYKQLIPYCILKDQDGNYFSYERTKKGGEPRLHSFRSLGVGGHVNPSDDNEAPTERAYINAMRRELQEEVGLPFEGYDEMAIAAINDDSNSVGRVHFGLVSFINLKLGLKEKLKLEDKLTNPLWLTPEQMKDPSYSWENWSLLLLNNSDKVFK
jgi:predicted NUDIX family phosphoesterase